MFQKCHNTYRFNFYYRANNTHTLHLNNDDEMIRRRPQLLTPHTDRRPGGAIHALVVFRVFYDTGSLMVHISSRHIYICHQSISNEK